MLTLLQALFTFLPSFLKIPLYRLLGAEIGSGAKISFLTILISPKIRIGPGAKISPLTIIATPTELQIGAFATIGFMTILNGPGRFSLACRAHLGSMCVLDLTDDIYIGEYTGIGPRTTMMTHTIQRPQSWGYKSTRAPIHIGEMVHGGSNVMIGQGVHIGPDVLLMPGSIILKDIKTYGLAFVTPDRTWALPQTFARKTKITRDTLRSDLIDAAIALHEAGFHIQAINGAHLTDYASLKQKLSDQFVDGTCALTLRKASTTIQLALVTTSDLRLIPNSCDWVFGFAFADSDFSTASSKQLIVDFHRLLRSGHTCSIRQKALLVLRKKSGYRFLPWDLRHESKLVPPPIV